MIEIIRTYQGYTRPEGRIKQSFAYMYRCKECELITPDKKEAKTHVCTGKREHSKGS
jgi:rRNA maturation endonuclease Nob1